MINIGEINKIKVARKVDIGYYLDAGTGNTSDDILLPNKSALNNELETGEEIDAFVYRDSSDRIIATLKKPLSKIGEIAYLKVVSTTKIGCFIDFGLEKDILVPFKEQVYNLKNGNSYLFYIYLDRTDRIAATTYIEKYLGLAEQYKIGDFVSGTVYGFHSDKSAMVAVDNVYKGLILSNEYFNEIHEGDHLDLRVHKIYDDGKLGLTPRKATELEVPELQDNILEYLNNHDRFMAFNDKTTPEDIYKTFHVSKKHFKIALGGLMKEGLITQDKNGTKLI